MARHAGTDNDFLAMALIGYEAEIANINAAIGDIRARLGEQAVGSDGQPGPKRRTMSAAGRKRVAAAQRKRWAAARAQGKNVAYATAPKKKRKLSAAGRRTIIEATRTRWAAYRKARGKKGKVGAKAAAAAS